MMYFVKCKEVTVKDLYTGFDSMEWQSFYHFTVGGPVEDLRLTTLPAYGRALPSQGPKA